MKKSTHLRFTIYDLRFSIFDLEERLAAGSRVKKPPAGLLPRAAQIMKNAGEPPPTHDI